MQTDTSNARLIEKEAIANLQFPKDEVLHDESSRSARFKNLRKATALGNIEHSKVRILFEDVDELKVVHTTIWATGSQNVILKRGVIIPIHRIHEVIIL